MISLRRVARILCVAVLLQCCEAMRDLRRVARTQAYMRRREGVGDEDIQLIETKCLVHTYIKTVCHGGVRVSLLGRKTLV